MGKIVIAAILLALAVVAIVYSLTRGGAPAPKLAATQAVVDVTTGEVKMISPLDWEGYKFDTETSYRIDPKTKHPISEPITCESCGKQIASPSIKSGSGSADIATTMQSYICPACHNPAYSRKSIEAMGNR